MATATAKPMFDLGRTVATPAALRALAKGGLTPHEFVERHHRGEWGDALSEGDGRLNEQALKDEGRLLSAYYLPEACEEPKVWVITEAVGDDGRRASTCVLLPSDY